MDSIYWVISRECNQRCADCYNDSGPGAIGLTPAEVSLCIAHFPPPDRVPLDRIILSGGEVLVWPELLFHALQELSGFRRYGTEVWIQTNGDRLDEKILDRLLAAGVSRIDVSSMDAFHPLPSVKRRGQLTRMFETAGMISADTEHVPVDARRYSFWGATEDVWIGPLWPRGRARFNGLSAAAPEHKFCQLWSGAKRFLNYRGEGSEVNIQLADVYPCCPMTCRPIGTLLSETLLEILDRCAGQPVFRELNEGRPDSMGITRGITPEFSQQRIQELGNECLWCDEFFTTYATDLLAPDCPTARGAVDLRTAQLDHHARRPQIVQLSTAVGGRTVRSDDSA